VVEVVEEAVAAVVEVVVEVEVEAEVLLHLQQPRMMQAGLEPFGHV